MGDESDHTAETKSAESKSQTDDKSVDQQMRSAGAD
jgi:hypothetical protein